MPRYLKVIHKLGMYQVHGTLSPPHPYDGMEIDPLSLSDDELVERLESFVEDERKRLHSFLGWLGAADSRGTLTRRGYASTFDYCVRKLRLSPDESYRRIHAARAAAIRPELLSSLSDGRLTLSTVSKLAPFAARADAAELISRAEDKTAREVDALLAPLHPEPEKRDLVRLVAVVPYSPSLHTPPDLKVDFTFRAPCALRDALDRAREVLSNKLPAAGMGELLLEIVGDYLARHDPQGGLPGLVTVSERSRVVAKTPGASRVPAAVRRAVWRRDGGRCRYVGVTGMRCDSRVFLELDHVLPRAKGGGDVEGNLRLLCRAHNDSERRRILGEGDP